MAKKVVVTPTQKRAAKMIVSRSASTGREVSTAISRIASAKPADSGRSTSRTT
jgi:hypothetical protein